jgi:RNA 2',3'-cyclic 3'-phosphodiesterase
MAHAAGHKLLVMPEQLSLPGFDPPPAHPSPPARPATPRRSWQGHTLFFAILPRADDLPRIEHITQVLLRRHGLNAKAIRPGRLHVTLHSLGNHEAALPDGLVDRAQAAAAGLVMPGFVLRLSKVLTFSGSRALVLCSDDNSPALSALRDALGLALAHAGLRPQASQTAHMTLAYAERDVAAHAIEPLSWPVHDFVLIHSLRGQGVHQHLGRWPLQASTRS